MCVVPQGCHTLLTQGVLSCPPHFTFDLPSCNATLIFLNFSYLCLQPLFLATHQPPGLTPTPNLPRPGTMQAAPAPPREPHSAILRLFRADAARAGSGRGPRAGVGPTHRESALPAEEDGNSLLEAVELVRKRLVGVACLVARGRQGVTQSKTLATTLAIVCYLQVRVSRGWGGGRAGPLSLDLGGQQMTSGPCNSCFFSPRDSSTASNAGSTFECPQTVALPFLPGSDACVSSGGHARAPLGSPASYGPAGAHGQGPCGPAHECEAAGGHNCLRCLLGGLDGGTGCGLLGPLLQGAARWRNAHQGMWFLVLIVGAPGRAGRFWAGGRGAESVVG
jgi:hypothetical protein